MPGAKHMRVHGGVDGYDELSWLLTGTPDAEQKTLDDHALLLPRRRNRHVRSRAESADESQLRLHSRYLFAATPSRYELQYAEKSRFRTGFYCPTPRLSSDEIGHSHGLILPDHFFWRH